MRPMLASLAAMLALAPALLTMTAAPEPAIDVIRVPLGQTRAGALRFLGGWALASRDRRFGGFSALAVDGDGFLAVSDAGLALRFALARGRVRSARFVPLGDGADKAGRDSESLTHDPSSGRWWIGYEGRNAIARLDPGLARAEATARPPAMAGWPANGGAESLIRLGDGRFVAIAEKAPWPGGGRAALMFATDPTRGGPPPVRFGYRPPAGYDPCDAALLPDGRILVLNRRVTLFGGFGTMLTLVDPRAIGGGRTIAGRPIATLAGVGNMEGLAVRQVGGATILWLISDDDFVPILRTLVLTFALDPIPE